MGWGDFLGGIADDLFDLGGVGSTIGSGIDIIGGIGSAKKKSKQAQKLADLQTDIIERQLQLAEQQFAQDTAVRERILSQTDALREALSGALERMGEIDPDAFRADVDREAITLAGSIGVADRMDRGLDLSTYDADQRAALAEAGARALQDAYTRAYDESLAYMTGLQDQILQNRASALDEIALALGATLPFETNLYGAGRIGAGLLHSGLGGAQSLYGIANQNAADAYESLGDMIEEFREKYLPSLSNLLGDDDDDKAKTPSLKNTGPGGLVGGGV